MSIRRAGFLAAILACLLSPLWQCSAVAESAKDIYSRNCATCHGANFEGGAGGSLVDGVWNHGGTDEAIQNTITVGIADAGMPAFAQTLSAEQIHSLVDFLRDQEKSFKLQSASLPKPEKVEDIYKLNCASCHGANFEGGLGGNLADGIWNHGGSDEEIARTITGGLGNVGMPAFGQTLSAAQIRSLVVFLREKEKSTQSQSQPPPKPGEGGVLKTNLHKCRFETVIDSGLKTPWSLAFLPDGRRLVTERPGALRIIDANGVLLPEPVKETPQVIELGQGGMLDVAIPPDYDTTGWIYLAFADSLTEAPKRAMLKIVRGRIRDNSWVDSEVVFQAAPEFYTEAGQHFGTRMVFDSGYLYFIVGERGGNMQAQDISRPNGKIYRVYPDGRIPLDNPFATDKKAIPGIWTYGHRNPQGLAVDPRDHAIYSTEHGPRGGDEFNLIRKGSNYGWPVICYGMNYDGTPLNGGLTEKEGMEQPLLHWTPSIATCGLACYTGDPFPNWKYDFFAGGLRGELHRIRVVNGKVTADEILFSGMGRVRDVRTGPDGYLYIVFNQPDSIVRLVPVE